MTLQKKATIVSSIVAFFLALTKLIVGFISGSVAVLASAIDSLLDLVISLFNYFAIKNSEKPADDTFNYGRGKIEGIAGVIEGTIIVMSGLFILYQSIDNIISQKVLGAMGISLGVMVFSFVATLGLVTFLNIVAKKTNNLVIKADALHYKTDLYSNGVILFSLVFIYFTDFYLIDSILGIVIAIYIIYSASSLIKTGVLNLMDIALDEQIVAKIEEVIASDARVNDYHDLRTRESGSRYFVDVHLVFDETMLLLTAHDISDSINAKIRQIEPQKEWVINMHLDPKDDSDEKYLS
ncbi:MAG: cation diffusion facilitator family transporter [Campylobacterota bacterium]